MHDQRIVPFGAPSAVQQERFDAAHATAFGQTISEDR